MKRTSGEWESLTIRVGGSHAEMLLKSVELKITWPYFSQYAVMTARKGEGEKEEEKKESEGDLG